MYKKLVKMLLLFIIDILFFEKNKFEDNYFNKVLCIFLVGKLIICK